MDWGAEGLRDGLEGEARAARGRLLDALHEAARAGYSFSAAGGKRLKGISEPVAALRLRRDADAA